MDSRLKKEYHDYNNEWKSLWIVLIILIAIGGVGEMLK
jgi:hypothetical protein